MARELKEGRQVSPSTLPAGRTERPLAVVVVLVSVAIFLTPVPFARMPLARPTAAALAWVGSMASGRRVELKASRARYVAVMLLACYDGLGPGLAASGWPCSLSSILSSRPTTRSNSTGERPPRETEEHRH
jgi:hypothetical protein